MPIKLDDLAGAAQRRRHVATESLTEAARKNLKTAFLCHSHNDRTYVEGLVTLLGEAGWQVYVDWQDASMPSTPNATTAKNIRQRIKGADYFLFLATKNSCASRWCPWELGIADGVKANDKIYVVPTRDSNNNNYGNEYLGLYHHIDFSNKGLLAAWAPGMTTGGRVIRDI